MLILLFLALVPAGSAQTSEVQANSAAAWRLPYIRFGQSAILDYDATTARMILFGGSNGHQFFNDVWALENVTTSGSESWTKLNPDGPWPPPRAWHTAVYDHDNRRMIVYGGHSYHYNFDDVWILDLTPGAETWTQLQPDGEVIGARRFHSAVYDQDRQQMVVFGGNSGGRLLNDTWALDLATPGSESWSQWSVGGSVPAARVQHTALYKEDSDIMVVFGGLSTAGLHNDTWTLNLGAQQWTQLPLADPPSARRGHAIGYNEVSDKMYLFGGLGSGGFLNNVWELDLSPGEVSWRELFPTGTPPAGRAWHAAAYFRGMSHWYVWGGRGMDSLEGETQWRLNIGGLNWEPIEPSLPGWWGGGQAAQSVQNDGIPDVRLEIEDAGPGTRAHLLLNSEVWFVVKLKTADAAYANDVDVMLDVVASRFDVTQVGTRHKDAHEVTGWTTPTSLGGGRYQIQDVDLTKEGAEDKYQTQVVFKATPLAQTRGTAITARAEGPGWTAVLESPATARIHADPPAWIVTNRTKLFDEYNNSEVRSLLDEIYEVAASRSAVVFYLDRHLPDLEDWDNTAVDYTSETTANEMADQVAEWLVGRIVSWDPYPTFAYPTYLAIVGDDNVVPRYRKADYVSISFTEDEAPNCSGLEPVCDDLVSHDFFFTDNPYGDQQYGTFYADWEDGGLEASVGRIVGGSAADMQYLLENAALGPNSDEDGAIIASGDGAVHDCFDWWLPGADNDPQNVLKIFMGYDVNESLIDSSPSKAQIVGEMEAGFSVAALAHHGEVIDWTTPDDADHLKAFEVPDYDPQDRMKDNLPFFYFDACRVGLTYGSGWDDPLEPEDGPQAYDDSLVYGLVHQGTSGVVASGGLMYLMPANNDWCCGETLSNDFWAKAKARTNRSNPLGWALRQAKRAFSIGGDVDKKTIQTFTYFGLPWTRLPGHNSGLAQAPASLHTDTTLALWSAPALTPNVEPEGPAAPDATYVVTANVDAATYAISTTVDGFDLIGVDSLSQRTEHGQVVLPQASLELVLPLSATVSGLVFTPTQDVVLPNLDIPTALAGVGVSGGPTGGYTTTVDGVYPVTATFESRVLDSYQLVRVDVVPVTYDATNDQATLYRSVDVAVEYDTPQTLALTHFVPDELQYLPGEAISVTAGLVNAGDVAETVTATLILQDAQGQIVGFEASDAFDVLAGGTYELELGWTGPLDSDVYLARLFIWQAGQVVTGAGAWVQVTAGDVSGVVVPETLMPGEEGTFGVTFDNLGASASIALAGLAIYDQDDSLVAFLPSQAAIVAGGGTTTLTFQWTPEKAGSYTASFVLQAGGQEYGPLSQNFDIEHRVYLPLVLRASP